MAAGGVQALLKGHRAAAGRRAVVAGTGPFLLPVATGLARAGVRVLAVCEANPAHGWLRHLDGAVRAPAKSAEAVRYAALMARHRIPYRTRATVAEILGEDRVRGVRLDGGEVLEADLVALGWGFTPALELPLMVGAATRRDLDGSLVAVVDARQRTTVPDVLAAGRPRAWAVPRSPSPRDGWPPCRWRRPTGCRSIRAPYGGCAPRSATAGPSPPRCTARTPCPPGGPTG
ncbi:hypothetical protein SVIO_058170 [Streptomyces violaceusniger]|uniref:FAD/NAD(P)-binding domain-containing protein n=1 Tax=Streptomyces violaceusniger TaxID=68280 RepID=A0A4D4L461_STRVO|nr:hypothetical protein SVIO_058170 [Streptomyces violaceusniger]